MSGRSRGMVIGLALVVLAGSALGCSLPRVPEINIRVPQLEIGELRDEQVSVPLPEASSVQAEVIFGAGELTLEAGSTDTLLDAHFIYNIEGWKPTVSYEDGLLKVQQGGDEKTWGVPAGNLEEVRNEWELRLSPAVPLDMRVRAGAGKGTLDFSGLALTALQADMGAGDFTLRFDQPNAARMERLTINAGASRLLVSDIGNAGPRSVRVQGGVGDMTLGFGGTWPTSTDVEINAGVGTLTLRLPQDVGVRVALKGAATDIEAPGFTRQGDAYVNAAFGQSETELRIEIRLGVGEVRLESE